MFRFRNKADQATRKALGQNVIAMPRTIRRSIGLMPDAYEKAMHEVRDTLAIRFHHLLVSLEGTKRTGCLKITSPNRRSRSAILLYRGRVVGCIYGQKGMRGQYLHQDAHKCAMADLAAPGNLLDAYELPEEMVLAAASLFYGETLDLSFTQENSHTFDYAVNSLLRCGLPGCVLINNESDQTICIVYIAAGKVVGMYSAHEGWLKATPQEAKRLLTSQPCRVHASILTYRDAQHFGFSLTGLEARFDFSPAPMGAAPSMAEPSSRYQTQDFSPQAARQLQEPRMPQAPQAPQRPQVQPSQAPLPPTPPQPPQTPAERRRTASQEAVAQAVRTQARIRRTSEHHHAGAKGRAVARV
ncbi:MAG: hypothetical protein K2X77_20065 [Candidatus Obscuribacterales bacterium]|nr:hypothetical protein [Candidatus Obscuribacterales bacterium]